MEIKSANTVVVTIANPPTSHHLTAARRALIQSFINRSVSEPSSESSKARALS